MCKLLQGTNGFYDLDLAEGHGVFIIETVGAGVRWLLSDNGLGSERDLSTGRL
jgi:hypothetical protein